jgi:hypothetical protein
MQPLASYLTKQMPIGMAYRDAAQLCIRLYITVHGVPESLLPLTKPKIGDAFAELAASGWVRDEGTSYASLFGAQPHEITDRGHWVEVMVSPVKKGPDVFDVDRAEELARQVGFVRREDPA